MLVFHRPLSRVGRKRTVGVPRFVLDHIAYINDDIAQRFARAPNVADADLAVPEIRVPNRSLYGTNRLISRIFGRKRDFNLVSSERFNAAVRQQVNAVYKISNVIFFGRFLANRSYDNIFVTGKVFLDFLIIGIKSFYSCRGHIYFLL